jgi:hypothetical protein
MFQIHKTEMAKLLAFERELEMRARRAARWRRADVLAQINHQRRRVRRAILLRQEFAGQDTAGPLTIADILERYS